MGYLTRILIILRHACLPKALQPLLHLPSPVDPVEPKGKQWIAVPYVPQIHRRLQSLLPEDVQLAPVAHDQIRLLYSTAKDKLPDGAITNVVYSIPCKTDSGTPCPDTYIGQTALSMRRRIINHRSTYSNTPLLSSLFTHVSNQLTSHTIDFDHPTILDRAGKRKELYVREAWAIHNAKNIMNAALECTPLPGPFRGLQQVANSTYVKVGPKSRRSRTQPKPLTLLWRTAKTKPPRRRPLPRSTPPAPPIRSMNTRYSLRPRPR